LSEPIVIRVFFKDKLIAVKQFEQDQIIIGKKGDAALVLRHKDVADLHCVIEKRGDSYFLCDLGSEVGTIIHNEKVLEHPLKSGDVFFINDLEVHFFIGTPTFTTPQNKPEASANEEEQVYVEEDLGVFTEESKDFFKPKSSESSPFIGLGQKKNNFNISLSNDKKETKVSEPEQQEKEIIVKASKKEPAVKQSASGFDMIDLEGRPEPLDNLSEGLNHKLGTFAPLSTHIDLDEVIDVNSRGSVVEVLLTWKERILSASHFDSKQKVFMGNKDDCQLKLSILNFKHYFININNGAEIRIPEKMDGFLYRGQQRIPLSTLKRSGQLQLDGDSYVLTLGQGEMIRCFLMGDRIQAYVRYVEQTPKAMPVPVFDFTSSELVSVAMAFIVSILIALFMTFNVPHGLEDIDTLIEDQYRIATVEFKPPPRTNPEPVIIEEKKEEPIKEKVVKKVTEEKKQIKPIADIKPTTNVPKQQSLGKKGAPKKVSVVDKEAGKPKELAPNDIKKPAKGLVSNKSGGAVGTGSEGANAQSKKKDVTKSGLLSVLSSGGAASNLDKAYSGAGTTFGLADKATGFGGQASDRQGEGLGTDLKNVGAGGKGTSTIGISGVGSKGRGGGETGYGGNNGLGDKGEVAIVNIEGNTNDFVSSIDKEAIRRIIRSNRNAIKSCYDLELTKNPTLSGKIVLQWQITEGGRMINAKVKSNDMTTNSLGPCIINRLSVLKFPDPGPDEIAEVAFPFVFEAR
jgi:pSer/pThr/pTyr-binding forkhead associated (FHA) protein